MANPDADLEPSASLQGMLGYLNFSEGKPDLKFQKQLSNAYGYLDGRGEPEPWNALHAQLRAKLDVLKTAASGPFRDTAQAEAVLSLVFMRTLPAYRRHHADLLFHHGDRDLYQPFFLARVFEAVLTQGPPWTEEERIVKGALTQLNDFVGHRPIAILETRPRGEPYEHERVRPIPLHLRGAGAATGRYRPLVEKALEILARTDPGILADAGFEPDALEELALDPRAYDHGHPANKRPNQAFGEWDPHHIDRQGRYGRYVVRQITLDALLSRFEDAALDRDETLVEAGAVLAGTILMATGLSGNGPTAHDSSTTLSTLMPRIARSRDAFYATLLQSLPGAHGDRLRREAEAVHQPFGGARQHLNQYIARHRAAQLQQRHLALLFANMGYPDEGRKEASKIPAASTRMVGEMVGRLITGQRLAEGGDFASAAPLLGEIEAILKRGIDCGAVVDPWNILGFQGLFPLFNAREDSVRDHRVDELVGVIEHLFDLYARVLSESAAAGDAGRTAGLKADLQRLASWWDRFATVEVQDVRRVHGGEAAASAEHVAEAMARWHERGEAGGDLAFWRQHLEGFRSPKAFALVINALLDKKDYRAAMALMMTWLSQVEQVPLEEGGYSFHGLALRWMLDVVAGTKSNPGTQGPGEAEKAGDERATLVRKFFDYLEANADEYWQVPVLEVIGADEEGEDEEEDGLYSAAYEDVTYRDSADDDQEGSIVEDGAAEEDFDLGVEGERLGKRLRFLGTVARLWQIAARGEMGRQEEGRAAGAASPLPEGREQVLRGWLKTAKRNQQRLLALMNAIHDYQVPEPLGSYDSLVEYDRRRVLKEQLLYGTIGTCLDTTLVVGTLQGMVEPEALPLAEQGAGPGWGPLAVRLEQALFGGDAAAARVLLPDFLTLFRSEPLVFTALADGGHPRPILRARLAQTILQALAANLPRLGLLRETYHLLKVARAMEQAHPAQGRGVTEFNALFHLAFQAVVRTIVDSSAAWWPAGEADRELVGLLESVATPFLQLWVEQSQSMLLSTLETVPDDDEWGKLRQFIQRYGGEIFHARFMTLANLRGILHRGVNGYLDYLRDNPDPLNPVRLIDDLDRRIPRAEAVKHLHCILQTVVENYEEYRDYNNSTTQSDYGENLSILLDFLRLKAGCERQAWNLRPMVLAHEILARKDRLEAARLWGEPFKQYTRQLTDEHLKRLAGLEQAYGVRLRTVSDRLAERFVKPLDLDRLCALIQPAMAEARGQGERLSFARLEQELQAYTSTPTGVGLDVPDWLRRLEAEVQRVRASGTAVAVLAEDYFRMPKVTLSLEEVQRQLQEWEKPLGE